MVKCAISTLGRLFWLSCLFWLSSSLSVCVQTAALAEVKGFIGARAAAQTEKLAAAPQTAPTSSATSAELSDNGETATLSFAISEPVDAKAFVMSEPDRVIVELPALNFQIEPQSSRAKPGARHAAVNRLVESYRFGSFAPGRSRVVIDLAGPARVVRTEVTKITGKDGFRLTIQLAKTDRTAFRAAAQASRTEMAAAAAEPGPQAEKALAPSSLPRIVIDPGHGGVDSGAMVGGLIEKFVVLDFAKALAAKLTASGHYNIVMTRDDDTFISLGDRVKMARDGNAALFVSVHADTLSETDVTGATVYTVSDKASDIQAARVAEKENQSDAAAGVEGKDETNGVSDILFDLTRRETRAYSHVFAHTLANYWKVAARLNKNPERSAGFRVLTAPDVPSVLLELGYLSNEKDASALNSQEWREKASTQVADAIESFFASRRAKSPEESAPSAPEESAKADPHMADPHSASTAADITGSNPTLVSDAKLLRPSIVAGTPH